MPHIYIGVDGGGTKTCTICIDSSKKILARYVSACTNRNSVGDEKAREALLSGIQNALQSINCTPSDVVGITLGMSGVDRSADKELVSGWVRELLPTSAFAIHNDAVSALASGTEGRLYGIVVISGTGMISYGVNDKGESVRAGGWGPQLGDLGAGYDIGCEVLKAVVRAKDGMWGPTAMSEKLLAFLKLEKEDELIPWAYSTPPKEWKDFASLAAIAHQCAREGDLRAQEIFKDAAKSLSVAITTVARRLGLEQANIPVVLAGGNLDHEDSLLASCLKDVLRECLPHATTVRPPIEPAIGTALMSLHTWGTTNV